MDVPQWPGGSHTKAEIFSTLAPISGEISFPYLRPVLIAGYHIQPHSIESGWSFLLFRGSSQTAQRSEVGVGRLPPPGRRPHSFSQLRSAHDSGLPLEAALAAFTLSQDHPAFGPAENRPRWSNATGKMSRAADVAPSMNNMN